MLWMQLAIQFVLCSTLKYYCPYVKDVARIAPPLNNSWYSDTSHKHHYFLVPVLTNREYQQVNDDVWVLYF